MFTVFEFLHPLYSWVDCRLLYRERDHVKLFSMFNVLEIWYCALISGTLATATAFIMRSTLWDLNEYVECWCRTSLLLCLLLLLLLFLIIVFCCCSLFVYGFSFHIYAVCCHRLRKVCKTSWVFQVHSSLLQCWHIIWYFECTWCVRFIITRLIVVYRSLFTAIWFFYAQF